MKNKRQTLKRISKFITKNKELIIFIIKELVKLLCEKYQ